MAVAESARSCGGRGSTGRLRRRCRGATHKPDVASAAQESSTGSSFAETKKSGLFAAGIGFTIGKHVLRTA